MFRKPLRTKHNFLSDKEFCVQSGVLDTKVLTSKGLNVCPQYICRNYKGKIMAVDLKIVKKLVAPKYLTETLGEYQKQTTCIYDLPIDWRYEFEERAAILQYDGRLSRDDADRRALQEIMARVNQTKKG
jgi:hypothetical protein